MHWQANEWPVLRRDTRRISSHIFQVLLTGSPTFKGLCDPLPRNGREARDEGSRLQVFDTSEAVEMCCLSPRCQDEAHAPRLRRISDRKNAARSTAVKSRL